MASLAFNGKDYYHHEIFQPALPDMWHTIGSYTYPRKQCHEEKEN